MKNNKSIYIHFGFDTTARDQAVARLRDKKRNESWEVYGEDHYLADKDSFFNVVKEACLTPDMFSGSKNILMNCVFLNETQLLSFLESIPEDISSRLFVRYGELGARAKKKLKAKAVLTEYGKFYQKDFINWLSEEFARFGKKVDRDALELMYQACSGKKEFCVNEIKKLVHYSLERKSVTRQDVLEVTTFMDDNEWLANDLVRVLFRNDRKQAADLFPRMKGEEILFFEVLREALRSFTILSIAAQRAKLVRDIVKVSDWYYKSLESKKFWEFRKVFAMASDLYGKLENVKGTALKSEKHLAYYGCALKGFPVTRILTISDLIIEFEIMGKNRTGFTVEGMQLLYLKVWELLHSRNKNQ